MPHHKGSTNLYDAQGRQTIRQSFDVIRPGPFWRGQDNIEFAKQLIQCCTADLFRRLVRRKLPVRNKQWLGLRVCCSYGKPVPSASPSQSPRSPQRSAARLSPLHDALQDIKVRGERLPGAARIVDDHRHATAGDQGECHGHAVVVICIYGHISLHRRRGRNDAEVSAFLDLRRAQLESEATVSLRVTALAHGQRHGVAHAGGLRVAAE